MSKKERNAQVGECPCIAKGCELVAAVFKFQQRGQDDSGKRFAGRLYGRCPDGHVFGTRGESQDWILKGTIWGDRKPGAAPEKAASAPVPAPVKEPEKPAPAPVPAPAKPAPKPHPTQQPKRGGFGFFR